MYYVLFTINFFFLHIISYFFFSLINNDTKMMPKLYAVDNQQIVKLKKLKTVKFLYTRCKKNLQ